MYLRLVTSEIVDLPSKNKSLGDKNLIHLIVLKGEGNVGGVG